MFDVITIGGATQDVFVRCDSAQVIRQSDARRDKAWLAFDYGAKLPIEQLAFNVGGGATNTAVTFKNLALKTACLVKVGHDGAGNQVLSELAAEGIDTSLVVQAEGQTGYSVILTSYEGERSILAFRGLNRELAEGDLDWERLKQTRWFFISSLSGPSDALLEPLLEFAANNGIKVAINPGNRQLERGLDRMCELLSRVDLLFMNKEEASRLTGIELVKPPEEHLRMGPGHPVRPAYMYDLNPQFKALSAAVKTAVVITDGKRGTQLSDGQRVLAMPVYPVEVADVLGAGDAFGSAFTAGWDATDDLAEAVKWGAANAAGAVTIPGAHTGLLDRAGIAAMTRQYIELQPLAFDLL